MNWKTVAGPKTENSFWPANFIFVQMKQFFSFEKWWDDRSCFFYSRPYLKNLSNENDYCLPRQSKIALIETIFGQWPKLYLGLNAQSEFQNRNGIYGAPKKWERQFGGRRRMNPNQWWKTFCIGLCSAKPNVIKII